MSTRRGRIAAALVLVLVLGSFSQAAAAVRFKPFTMPSVDGRPTTLAEVMGTVTLVVFFFPTCGFCNAWLPEAQALQDRYEARGLSTVWINVVPGQDGQVAAWRASRGLRAPVLLGGRSAQRDYKVRMTPTHVLLDAQGQVVFTHAGYGRGDAEKLEAAVRRALGVQEGAGVP